MPSARSSESDSSSALQQQLALLVRGRTRSNLTGDDILQAFQDADQRSKGYISSKSDVINVLCDTVTSKYQRRVDFDMIFTSFRTKNARFDYTAFCEAFEKKRKSEQLPPQKPMSPKKSSRGDSDMARSPLKSPHKRSNWLIQQQQKQANASENDTPRDLDGINRAIRVDPRLETQRLLSQSIRRKLLAGVLGTKHDGFNGIQDLLFMLDEAGEGYIDDDVFASQVLRRLKKPLTKQEAHFLLANLRAHTESTSRSRPVIHYEHLASLCNLDSDASADEADDAGAINLDSPKKAYPVPPGDAPLSVGGADFLAAEKRLRDFFQQPIASTSNGSLSVSDTPRSIPTGAEAFLDQAEALDPKRVGLLTEHDFHSIFATLRLDISYGLARAMLERFPRSSDQKVDYRAFLERYGENPELSRERRKLKRMLTAVLASVAPRHVDKWFQYLASRFEKYDTRLHKHPRGDIPQQEFVHVLRRSSTGPVKLAVDDATAITAQFLRISRSSRTDAVTYRAFLALLRDCRAQANASLSSEPASSSACTGNHMEPSAATAAMPSDANVADYLIHDATEDERQHFELLMDALHKFQQRISSKGNEGGRATSTSSPDVPSAPHRAQDGPHDSTETQQHSEGSSQSTGSRVGEITPIDNGILLALGGMLQVRIQFAVAKDA